jgi:hypothetical protein
MKNLSFDLFAKKDEILKRKQPVPSQEPIIMEVIVYFFNDSEDIIYIARKKGFNFEVGEYVRETAIKKMASSFSLEAISENDLPEDALAERILAFKPYENKFLPPNNKFISSNKAKEHYRISKPNFKKFINEVGGFEHQGLFYAEKNYFLDYFDLVGEFKENLPKEGDKIVTYYFEKFDQCTSGADIYVYEPDQRRNIIKETDGSSIEEIKTIYPSKEERSERIAEILNNSWLVTQVKYDRFEAQDMESGKVLTFFADDFQITWTKGLSHV